MKKIAISLFILAGSFASQAQYTPDEVARYRAYCELRSELDAHLKEISDLIISQDRALDAIDKQIAARQAELNQKRAQEKVSQDEYESHKRGLELFRVARYGQANGIDEAALAEALIYFVNKALELDRNITIFSESLITDELKEKVGSKVHFLEIEQTPYRKNIMDRLDFHFGERKMSHLSALELVKGLCSKNSMHMQLFYHVLYSCYNYCQVMGLLYCHAGPSDLERENIIGLVKNQRGIFVGLSALKAQTTQSAANYSIAHRDVLSQMVPSVHKAASSARVWKQALKLRDDVVAAHIFMCPIERTLSDAEREIAATYVDFKKRLNEGKKLKEEDFGGLLYLFLTSENLTRFYRVAQRNLSSTIELLQKSQDPNQLKLPEPKNAAKTDSADQASSGKKRKKKKKNTATQVEAVLVAQSAASSSILDVQAPEEILGSMQSQELDEACVPEQEIPAQAPQNMIDSIPLTEVEQLQKGTEVLPEQGDTLQKKNAQVKALKAELKDQKEQVKALNKQRAELAAQLQGKEKVLAKRSKQLDRSTSMRDGFKQQIVDLELEITAKNRAAEGLEQEVASKSQAAQKLRNTVKRERDAKKRLSLQLSQAQAGQLRLQEEIEQMKDELEARKTAFDQAKAQLEKQQKLMAVRETELTELLQRQAHDKSQNLAHEINHLQAAIAQEQTANWSLVHQIRLKEHDYWQSAQANAQLLEKFNESKIGQLEAEVRRLQSALQEVSFKETKALLALREQSQLKEENARLRALLVQKGIDPDKA